jgi:hypothetical protein
MVSSREVIEAVLSRFWINTIFEISKEDKKGILIEATDCSEGEGFLPFYCNDGVVADYHPNNKERVYKEMAEDGWNLGGCLYAGVLTYEDLSEMIEDMSDYSFQFEIMDNPANMTLGYKVKNKKITFLIPAKIALSSEQKSYFTSLDKRRELLKILNTKPIAD